MRTFGRTYDPSIYNLRVKRPMALDAYCQSPRYFRDIEELLRKDLEFTTVPAGLSDKLAGQVLEANSVCLHIRRQFAMQADGSISQNVADFYGTCEIGYYRSAIQALAEAYGNLRIYVFSDDIDWALQNAGAIETGGCSVTVIEDVDPLRSFYLMRLCKHFIIANSTFSWWAAWLGQYSMKTVCVPPVWNREERRFPRDLFPSDWKIVHTASITR